MHKNISISVAHETLTFLFDDLLVPHHIGCNPAGNPGLVCLLLESYPSSSRSLEDWMVGIKPLKQVL
jgi:hypothetical protein